MENFFGKLSERLYDENHLSDVTWALCESHQEFKKVFLSFFFEEFENDDNVSDIVLKREFKKYDSRPDLYFSYNGNNYVIEVKLDDKDDHIQQYRRDFDNPKFGWIAKYEKKHKDVKTRTWEDFYFFLEEIGKFNPPLKELTLGYQKYLKNICSIIKIKKMNLQNLLSLYHFNHTIEKVIQEPIENVIIKKGKKYFSEESSGRYFNIYKTKKIKIQPWFGIYYNDIALDEYQDGVCICVELYKGNCKAIWDKISKITIPEGDYHSETYKWEVERESYYYFEMKEDYLKKFNEEGNEKTQKQMLQNFFNEVVNRLYKYL